MSRLQISSTPPPVSAYEHLQRDLRRMSPYMKKELSFYDYDEKKLYFETMDDYNCEVKGWIPLSLHEASVMYKLDTPASLAQVENLLLNAATNPSLF